MILDTAEEAEAWLVEQIVVHTVYDPTDVSLPTLLLLCFNETEAGWELREGGITDLRVTLSMP